MSSSEWTEEERHRYEGILKRSSDRVMGRQRREEQAQSNPSSSMPEEVAREVFGKHYDNVKAEVDFRREIMGTAKAMDEGKLPVTPEAVNALLQRQKDWFDTHTTSIIPPGDINFDAMKK